jgi:hypothetical protein
MKKHSYAVCPHCQHPNIHVEQGALVTHHVTLTGPLCLGSKLQPKIIRTTPIERTSEEYTSELQNGQTDTLSAAEIQSRRPTFKTWRFCGIEFIAIPGDRDSEHIMDALGANYGSWMSVAEFRKRQQSGILADWQSLGRAHLSVVCER